MKNRQSEDKRIRVLITAPSLDESQNVSGISSVARQIVERGALDYRHFEAGRRDGEHAGFRWICKQLWSIPRFWREIKIEKIEVVHLNTTLTPLAILRDSVYALTARLAGVPVLTHIHGGRFLVEEFESRFLAVIAEKMFRASRRRLVLSTLEREILARRWRDLKFEVLENAVPVDEIKTARSENKEPVLIFLGRLHESKGLHEIIEAARILKNAGFDFRFNCFGAGDLKDFFAAEMTAILGDKFYYGGVAAGAERWKQLAEADIFVLPSRYGEGLPMALLEAMAAGCIAVVAEMASIGAVVRDGENGYLIKPGNSAELVEKLKFLFHNRDVWENVRKRAAETVKEKFSLDDYIKKLEGIYLEIVAPE